MIGKIQLNIVTIEKMCEADADVVKDGEEQLHETAGFLSSAPPPGIGNALR